MTVQRLETGQRLNLIPTQRMQFALTVLAMPYQEMEARLREDLQDNILLEESAPDAHEMDEYELMVEEGAGRAYTAQSRKGKGLSRKKSDDGEISLESRAMPVTLAMILEQQVGEQLTTEEEKEIARWIIGNLNEKGYLETEPAALAEAGGIPLERLEQVRQQVMRFTPTGCGATGLGECLAVQVLERWGAAARKLAQTLREAPRRLLSAPYAEREARRLGLPDAASLFHELRRLNPAPGLQYVTDAPYTPPVDIRFHEENGKWIIDINGPDMDGWRLRPEYHPDKLDAATRRFLMPYVRSLRFWRYALRLRRDTLYQMAQWLLKYQMEFVRHGPRHLEPFTMTNAAEHLGVSVSTISRCVQNKILHFAWGTFPFREVFRDIRVQRAETTDAEKTRKRSEPAFPAVYFPGMELPAGANGWVPDGGRNGAGQVMQLHEHVVREALMRILQEESVDCVYPDEVLALKLKEQGIPVSRRCLAGYRQRWGIGHRGQRLTQLRLAGEVRRSSAPPPVRA